MLKNTLKSTLLAIVALLFLIISCKDSYNTEKSSSKIETRLSIEFEKYQLENGLDVVLHQDKSDPIV